MSSEGKAFKVVITFERRDDGGLRVWSDDVPGFVLSHHDTDAVIGDIAPALETILSARLGGHVVAQPLVNLKDELERSGVVEPDLSVLSSAEYVAHYAH